MLKALLKKQLLELNQFYFRDRKTGKLRSRGGTIGMIVLYIGIFALLGVMLGSFETMLYQGLAPLELAWLYWLLCTLMAVVLGVFGSVFNTYAALYLARDNDLLLSMPIPPSKLLIARMAGVYAMGLLYEAIAFVPAMVVPCLAGDGSASALGAQLVLLLVVGVVILVLTCALGWVVALVSTKLKNRSFLTVLLSLAFIAVYYLFYFKLSGYIQTLIARADAVAVAMQTKAWPLYQLGRAACGSIVGLLVTIAIAALLFAALMLVMSRSFLRITTASSAGKKSVVRRTATKCRSLRAALLRKELRRFTSSATYMLNAGLGLVLMPVVAVAAAIRGAWLRGMIAELAVDMPSLPVLLPVLAAAAIGLAAAMNFISAPSVALEGRNLWILQSLPLRPQEALRAKLGVQFLLTAPTALLLGVVLSLVLRIDALTAVLVNAASLAFAAFSASLGLVLGLQKPNLSWTNEAVPIKQSMASMAAMFGGWLVALAIALGYWPLADALSPAAYLGGVTAVLALGACLCTRWLTHRGAAIFEQL